MRFEVGLTSNFVLRTSNFFRHGATEITKVTQRIDMLSLCEAPCLCDSVVKFRCCREVGGLNFEVREDLAESFHHGATEGSKVTQRIATGSSL